MQKAGVQTARYFKSVPGQHLTETSIPIAFPLFLKPVIGGDSRGVDAFSYVHDFASFKAKVSKIYSKQNNTTLAEAYLTGREFTVGVLQDCKTHNCTTMPVEIIASKNKNGHRILDFHIKKNDTEQVVAGIVGEDGDSSVSPTALVGFRGQGGVGKDVAFRWLHQAVENRSALDRSQLIGIADENHFGFIPERVA